MSMLFGDKFLGDELTGGELDGVGVGILRVRGAGEFECGLVMADGEGNLLSDEVGMGGKNGGADDKAIGVGV